MRISDWSSDVCSSDLHVAFAGLSKFDGKRHRRLTISEMAQIAGRAGRHQRDGTFGTVQLGTESETLFEPAEIEAVKGHDFDPLTHLEWRNARQIGRAHV